MKHYTYAELSKTLSLSQTKLREYVHAGKLVPTYFGRSPRFPEHEVNRFTESLRPVPTTRRVSDLTPAEAMRQAQSKLRRVA